MFFTEDIIIALLVVDQTCTEMLHCSKKLFLKLKVLLLFFTSLIMIQVSEIALVLPQKESSVEKSTSNCHRWG